MINDWDWQFVAEYVRTYNSNEVELIIQLGFDMRAHMRFLLEGIELFSMHSQSDSERKAARKYAKFIDTTLKAADSIVVYSTRIENTNNYIGNVLYKRANDNEWYFLSNEIKTSGIIETMED